MREENACEIKRTKSGTQKRGDVDESGGEKEAEKGKGRARTIWCERRGLMKGGCEAQCQADNRRTGVDRWGEGMKQIRRSVYDPEAGGRKAFGWN